MEKHLQDKEALEKFQKLVKEIRICMFITNNAGDEQAHTRPMATIDVEESGTLWFYTNVHSIKVDEVQQEQEAHLVFSHPGIDSYLDVWGSATVVTDRGLIKEKWSAMVKPWFPAGPEDPNIALLRIEPTRCYYWDSETGKMVQFAKMAVAAVTGNPKIAEGAEGKLSL